MAEKDKDDIVTEARKRFDLANDANKESRQNAIEDTRFAMGDSDNGWQWPDQIRRGRIIDQKVCLTVNLTAQHCNQIINNIRQNRPSARVSPVDNGADKRTAEILGGLIRNIQVSSNADDAHDTAAEHAIYGGEGYWRIITDYESETSFDQVILIKPVLNPQLVYIDPNAQELDKSDAEWGFIFEDIGEEQFKRDYPDLDPASWSVNDKAGWVKKDTFRRAEYFYCTYEKDTALLLADGSTVLKSTVKGPVQVVKERETQVKKWTWCEIVGGADEPQNKRPWPGSFLPIVTVVGKEINVNGEIVRKGIVRDLKDPARMVNYSYSETVQGLALQNKVPYMAASEAIEGYEDIWKSANIENRAYLPYNAFDDEGQALPMPQRQPPPILPAAQVQLLQLSTEQMRAASGQQNANFGIKSEASSGIGIQRLKVQGDTATFHFPDNLTRAMRYEGKVLIDLIQKVYDTRRVIRILGLDGKDEQVQLDPEQQGPYQEAQTLEGEIAKIFNPSVGRYDVVIDTGPSYQTQRQESFSSMMELSKNDPSLMQKAGDLIIRSADFPMADEIAKRLEKTLPPELRDQKGDPTQQLQGQLQQVTQQLQQAGGAIEAMQKEIERLEMEKQAKAQQSEADIQKALIQAKTDAEKQEDEHNVARYKAETERMSALAPAFGPVEIKALVMQTMQEMMGAPPLSEPEQEPLMEPSQGGFSLGGQEQPMEQGM